TASDYSFSFVNGILSVGKAIPVINWSNPADITYGTALSATQLNATATDPNNNASIAGTFTYGPLLGARLHAGNNQSLAVNFVPSDTTNYSTPSQKTVAINVTKATLTITGDNKTKSFLATNPALTFTSSGFVNGDTASVLSGASSFSTTAMSASTVNSYSITASQGTLNTADYNFNFTNGALTVTKATPVVNWSNPTDITFGTALSATQLNGTVTNPNDGSSVTGASNYSPGATTMLNGGNNQMLAVNFTPSDTTDYNTPVQKTVSINVLKADQTINFGVLLNKVFCNAQFTVSATVGHSSVPVNFSIVSGPATISGNTVTITSAGTVTVRASQASNGNYNAAPSFDQSFIVTSAPGLTPITGRFVFTFNFLGLFPVNISNADGTFVNFNIAQGQNPGWSPDSTKIVFARVWNNGANQHISTMNADGSNQVRMDTNETD